MLHTAARTYTHRRQRNTINIMSTRAPAHVAPMPHMALATAIEIRHIMRDTHTHIKRSSPPNRIACEASTPTVPLAQGFASLACTFPWHAASERMSESEQASKRASEQASKRASEQASKRASEQASKRERAREREVRARTSPTSSRARTRTPPPSRPPPSNAQPLLLLLLWRLRLGLGLGLGGLRRHELGA